MRCRAAILLAIAWVLLPAACSDGGTGEAATATQATAASTTTVPGDAAPPDASEDVAPPYRVGHVSITVVDPSRDRTLPVEVWYPVDPDADLDGLQPTRYPLLAGSTSTSEVSIDGAPAAGGPFPVVVFSHGNGGNRTQSTYLTEALASHGFVVASPDHVGNTTDDVGVSSGIGVPQARSAFDRPRDVRVVIDRILAADAGDPWVGRVDPEHIGVTGHSFGGLTSMLVAQEVDGEPFDDRVDAIAAVAPASPQSDEALRSITVPMLLVGGTLDTTTPIDPNLRRPFELVSSTVVRQAVIDRAGHLSFADVCAHVRDYRDRPDADPEVVAYIDALFQGGCADRFVAIDLAHQLTARYVVAFFRWQLAGDEAAADQLVSAPGAEVTTR